MTGVYMGLGLLAIIIVGCTLWLSSRIAELERSVRLGPVKALMENIAQVRRGASKNEVQRRLGSPDEMSAEEWTYFFAPQAGYRIMFDTRGRVDAVRESIG